MAPQPRKSFTEETIPVPLRAGNIVVRFTGLPGDLTEAEALHISAVIYSLVERHHGEPAE